MKKALWTLSALAVLGFGLVGCEDDEENLCATDCSANDQVCVKTAYDHYICVDDAEKCSKQGKVFDDDGLCVSSVKRDSCESDNDCEADETCSSNRCVDKGSVAPQYKYVLISDLSKKCEDENKCKDDPGADIDAVVLRKYNGGGEYYATSVAGYQRSDGKTKKEAGQATDPSQALGKPDSFAGYANGSNTTGECVYYKDAEKIEHPYVSLGGVGGFLMLEMGAAIEVNDNVDVLEVGKCSLTNTKDGGKQTAQAEEIKVQISTASDKNGTWKDLGSATASDQNKGVLSFTISASNLQ